MKKILTKFFKDEAGAITVDWVVLTAAILALGFVIGAKVWTGTVVTSETVGAALTDYSSDL